MGMANRQPIGPGQRYRDIGRGVFGASALQWVVETVFTGVDGVAYAHLVCITDRSQRKTLSLAVLGDRRRFVRIEEVSES